MSDIIENEIIKILKGFDIEMVGKDYEDALCYRSYILKQRGEIYDDVLRELIKVGLTSIEFTPKGLLLHFTVDTTIYSDTERLVGLVI